MRRNKSLAVLSLFFSIALVVSFARGQTAGQPRNVSVPAQRTSVTHNLKNAAKRGEILELRSGGHRLGFLPDRAFLAARNHALTVEFRGTPGAMPQLLDLANNTADAANTKVLYEDLWPGISLTYETNSKGITESTYTLASGADVANIRLRYNVPVSLEKNGTLKFKFSTGYFTESSPEAWQEINGKRVSVTVAFREANGEVGFRLGNFDPRYPLTIDPICRWQFFQNKSAVSIQKRVPEEP